MIKVAPCTNLIIAVVFEVCIILGTKNKRNELAPIRQGRDF